MDTYRFTDDFEYIVTPKHLTRPSTGDIFNASTGIPILCREILRLAEENAGLRQHVQRLGDEGERLKERGVTVLAEEAERVFQEGTRRERVRIRRELLAALANSPGGGEDGESIDLTWTDLRSLVNRICPG